MEQQTQESLVQDNRDPLIHFLNKIVVYSVKCLAILMVIVILWSLVDVAIHMYRQITASFQSAYNIDNLISIFGVVLAVLIGIEIFLNIIFYLKRDAVHVPLVLATALTAVARKVIVLDYNTTNPNYIFATAAAILAVGVTYWLVTKRAGDEH